MAAITAANVVVTLNPDDIDRSPDGRIGMRTFPVVQFGNAALTYPALGVPMPAIGKFGFHFAIKRAYIENPGNGYIYSFDRANHKVRIWLGAAQAAITVANHTNIEVPAATGNLASNVITFNPHSHDLVIAANTAANIDSSIGANAANKLVANEGGPFVIPGGVAANGGVANATQTGVVNALGLTMEAPANIANLTHVVTGGGAVAESALAELDNTVAPAATTLYMEMVGR